MKMRIYLATLTIILFCSSTIFGQFQLVFTDANSIYSMTSNQSFIFAGTGGSGIYRSDSGSTWNTINNGIPAWYYYSTQSYNDTLYAGSFGHVNFSYDNGNSWNDLNLGLGLNDFVFALARNDQYLYAGVKILGAYNHVIGNSGWSQANTGLASPITINDFLVVGSDTYAATDTGIYLSSNNSGIWTLLTNGLPSILSANKLLYDTNTNIIFAATESGVFKSSDYGISWSVSNTGLPLNVEVKCLAVLNDTIFAGTNTDLYASIDHGVNWFSFNGGLPGFGIYVLATFNNALYAATGNRIYRYPELLINGISSERYSNNISFYPNPCNDFLEIDLPYGTTESLVILFDNTGRKIKAVKLNERSAIVDMSSLESGMYFMRLELSDNYKLIKVFKK